MNKEKITLYHYWRSSSSWRVRWAFELKNISYELCHVNLLTSEHNHNDYLKCSPSGYVPCVKVGDQFFSESCAVIEWLEETYPEKSIFPKEPLDRMRVRQMAQVIISGVQPLQNLKAQRYFSIDSSKQKEYARFWITEGFRCYERLCQLAAKKFSFGSNVSFADLCLIPQVYNAQRFGVRLEDYPLIKGIYKNCLETAECRNSSPERFQPKL